MLQDFTLNLIGTEGEKIIAIYADKTTILSMPRKIKKKLTNYKLNNVR